MEEVWECQWTSIKQHMKNRKKLEEQARNQNIAVRDALFWGRTEGFKSYYCCNSDEKIHYFDVVSLYPTVNALDKYPIGFGHYETYKTVDEFLFALDHDICFGLAKVNIVSPKNLYVPVLPDRSKGKLLFHLDRTTIELKKAVEKGYDIKKVDSVLEYDSMNGLMRDYVGNFLKTKIENSGVMSLEESMRVTRS